MGEEVVTLIVTRGGVICSNSGGANLYRGAVFGRRGVNFITEAPFGICGLLVHQLYYWYSLLRCLLIATVGQLYYWGGFYGLLGHKLHY